MTITEGAPVSNVDSTGLVNFVTLGGAPGMVDGGKVFIAASHNRAGGSLATQLVLTGPGTADAEPAGAIAGAMGAHYCAAWVIPITDVDLQPAVGETNPAAMWRVSAYNASDGTTVSNGDMAIAAFAMSGVKASAPSVVATGAQGAATTTTMIWTPADAPVADTTTYFVGSTERDLDVVPVGPLSQMVDIKSANATVGRRTTLFIGKVHNPTSGDLADQTATIGATARQWRTLAATLAPASLSANAGPNQSVQPGERVILDGSGSSLATSYEWVQLPGAGVPTVILADADTVSPEFVAQNDTLAPIVYDLQLTVGDGSGTASDTVSVSVAPPVAAGSSLQVFYCDGTQYA